MRAFTAARASRRRLTRLVLAALALLAPGSLSAGMRFAHRDDAIHVVAGTTPGGAFGQRVDLADIDGDGRADLVTQSGDGNHPIRVHLDVAGLPARTDIAATPADVVIDGARAGDTLTWIGARDMDGDGRVDLVVTSTDANAPGGSGGAFGQVDIFLHRAPWPARLAPADADVRLYGSVAARITRTTLGDLDDDGLDDVILCVVGPASAATTVKVLRANPWPATLAVETEPGLTAVLLDGSAAATVGDIDADGRPDFVVDDIGAGLMEVVLGRPSWPATTDLRGALAGDIELARSSGPDGTTVGDVTGDAVDDIVMVRDSGVSVWPGGSPSGPVAWMISLRDTCDYCRPMAITDVDGDAIDDLVVIGQGVGARRADPAARVSVFRGPLTLPTRDVLSQPADWEFFGRVARYAYGSSAAVGDIDGDGRMDLAMGHGSSPRLPVEDTGEACVFRDMAQVAPAVPAPALFVDATAPAPRDGLAWSTAFATIEDALQLADTHSGVAEIRVATGTQATCTLGSSTLLLGGYEAGGGRRDPVRFPTRLVAEPTTGGGYGVIAISAGLGTEASRLDGVTFSGLDYRHGAGTGAVIVTQGDVTVANCVFTDNSTAAVIDWFSSCIADPGSRTCVEWAPWSGLCILVTAAREVRIVNNLFHHNRFTGDSCFGWNADCTLTQGAWTLGPILARDFRTMLVQNNTFADNAYGGPAAGGRTLSLSTTLSGSSVRIVDNVMADGVEQIGIGGSSARTIANNVFATDQPAYPFGNVVADPRFIDAARSDYRLSHVAAGQAMDSPAIDFGEILPAADSCPPAPCLDEMTTGTDGLADSGRLDAGFHRFIVPNSPPTFGGVVSARVASECVIELSWTAAIDPDGDAVSYQVFRATSSGGQVFSTPLATVPAPRLTYSDSVPWGAPFFYVVRAVDARGASEANTREVTATPVDTTPPRLSFDLAVAGCDVSELPRVGAVGCAPLARVEVHRSTIAGFVPDATTLVAVDPPSFSETVPAPGLYYYRRIDTDAAGNASTSRQILVRAEGCGPSTPRPGDPSIVALGRVGGGIGLVITAAPGADFHRLWRGTLADMASRAATYDHVVSVGADRSEDTPDDIGDCMVAGLALFDDDGLSPGSFYYLVSGMGPGGEGVQGFDSFGREILAAPGALDCP